MGQSDLATFQILPQGLSRGSFMGREGTGLVDGVPHTRKEREKPQQLPAMIQKDLSFYLEPQVT